MTTTHATTHAASLDERIHDHPGRFRVLTGDRPTGRLHLGHYLGTLHNRVRLQNLGVPMYILIADYQVLTDRDSATGTAANVEEILLDHLAASFDPERGTIFTHSAVPAFNQLLLPFLSLVSVAELRRNPTVKDEIAQSRQATVSGLMFTYPAHQAADILACKANLVPVGHDQLPHLELTRTIARRFNERYGPVFPEPQALLSEAPLLLGTDGTKMSKSRGNAIPLAASADTTAALIRRAKTDTQRHITYDPEHRPEVASLIQMAALCSGRTPDEIASEAGPAGAAALKRIVTEAVNEHLAPLRARRAAYASDRGHLRRVLRDGNERAGTLATATLQEVRTAMGHDYRPTPHL